MVGGFNDMGFVWKRGAIPLRLLGEAPKHSSRNVNLSSELMSACQMAVSDILPGAFPTRTTLFAKSSTQSWSLGWHQDRVIAVAEKHDMPGYINWTRKDGIWHVEPPVDVLNKMVFVQVYLDLVGPFDGPMQLSVGSHLTGKFLASQKTMDHSDIHTCQADRGDILMCKFLTLHRSLPSQTGQQRRILRIDFANYELPEPLEWARL